MEKIEKRTIEGINLKGAHLSTYPDTEGRVALYWCISTNSGLQIDIYYNRFEVFVPNRGDDHLELVIPLKGHYKNCYALSAEPEAADQAFDAAHGLIKAVSYLTYDALR